MRQKNQTPFWIYIFVGIIILICSYYIGGLFSYRDITFANMNDCLLDIILHFWQVKRLYNDKTVACLGVGCILWVFLCYYIQLHYRNFQSGIEYGAEDWADIKDLAKRRRNPEEKKNLILSKNISLDTCGKGKSSNNNILMVASSGRYKTTGFVMNNLLQGTDHYIVLDVKGELMYKLGLFLEKKHGYKILSLNIKHPEKSMHYNPFRYITCEKDLINLIENIYQALDPPDASTNDPFWIDGPKLFLQSMFFYEYYIAKKEGREGCMNNILKLCNEQVQPSDEPPKKKGAPPPSKLQVRMRELANESGFENPAVRDYYKFIGGASETVKSITIIVQAKLKLMELPEIKRIFEDDDMHLEEFAYGYGGTKENPTNQKIALFLCADDMNPALNFIFSMLYAQALDLLSNIADNEFANNNGSLPIPVGFWMDELYAGARPSNLVTAMGVVRSRNIYIVPMLQSMSQLQDLYGEDKMKILREQCATFLFYGAAPSATEMHEYIANLLGDMTFDAVDDSHSGMMQATSQYKKMGGKMMDPAAVKRMPKDECIVFLESEYPAYDSKLLPWEDKKSPFHEAMRYNKESKDGGYVTDVEVVYNPREYCYITLTDTTDTTELIIDGEEEDFLKADLRDNSFESIKDAIQWLNRMEAITEPDSQENDELLLSNRDLSGSLIDVWERYYEELTEVEKEHIITASSLGLQEEEIKKMFNMTPKEMNQFIDTKKLKNSIAS